MKTFWNRPSFLTAKAAAAAWLCVLSLGPTAAAFAQPAGLPGETDDGQYRSKVRIIPEDEVAAPVTAGALPQDPYGKALLLRRLGYAQAGAGQLREAIRHLEETIALEVLAEEALQPLRFDLAQLYAAAGLHAQQAAVLETWLHNAAEENPQALFLLAAAFAQLEQAEKAVQPLRRAIAASDPVPPDWRRLLAYLQVRAGDPAAAAAQYDLLLRAAPDDAALWIETANLYLAADDALKAVDYLGAAERLGMLKSEAALQQLLQLYLATGLPLDAGRLLERAIQDGRLTPGASLWAMAADAWLRARETDSAIQALQRSVQLERNASRLYRLGALLAERGDWAAAGAAMQEALRGRTLGADRANGWLILGEARYRGGDVRGAASAFREAASLGGSYATATRWLDFLATVSAPAAAPAPVAASLDTHTGQPPEIKQVNALRLFQTVRATTLPELGNVVGRMVRELVIASRRERLEWNGPLQFITHPLADRQLELTVAAPVLRGAPPRGQFRTRSTPPFRCAWRVYEGSLEDLGAAWQQLEVSALAAGLSTTGERRQVVLEWSRDPERNSRFELQLGIE